MVAYTEPQKKRKEEESERLRGERDQIKFIDLRFEGWQVVRFRKARKGKTFHKLHVLGMSDDLWDRVRGLGRETCTVLNLIEYQIEKDSLFLYSWQVVRFRKARKGKTFHKLHVLGMSDDLWDKVRGLGSEINRDDVNKPTMPRGGYK